MERATRQVLGNRRRGLPSFDPRFFSPRPTFLSASCRSLFVATTQHFPTRNQACTSLLPHSWVPHRRYDRKRYLKEKAKQKAEMSEENIPFATCFDIFKQYAMGQDLTVTLHIESEPPQEGSKLIRGDVSLPKRLVTEAVNGAPKEILLVFAKGEDAERAKALGAEIVGGEELVNQIASEGIEDLKFTRCLATIEMFKHVVKLGRILGPKGLMPSPSKGTVSESVEAMMASLETKTKFEIDADGFIHIDVGKTSWLDADVFENICGVLGPVLALKPSKMDTAKYIKAVVISAPYTPGMRLPQKPFRLRFSEWGKGKS
ncbi:ribosomal protein L1-like protein [Cladochytrium replicatum]|nr:ribosomal protein L1-like protein [Cladochytrium replicatum]